KPGKFRVEEAGSTRLFNIRRGRNAIHNSFHPMIHRCLILFCRKLYGLLTSGIGTCCSPGRLGERAYRKEQTRDHQKDGSVEPSYDPPKSVPPPAPTTLHLETCDFLELMRAVKNARRVALFNLNAFLHDCSPDWPPDLALVRLSPSFYLLDGLSHLFTPSRI